MIALYEATVDHVVRSNPAIEASANPSSFAPLKKEIIIATTTLR